MDFDAEIVRRVREGKVPVPPYPAVALKVGRLLREPHRSLSNVVAAVKTDSTLAGSVLRLANSARYGGLEAITTLDLAVGRIGERELLRVALASSLGGEALRSGPLGRIRRHIWHDAITAAAGCEVVAAACGLDGGELFAAGLLHDVGRMVALSAIEQLLAEHPDEPSRKAYEWWGLIERFHVELGLILAAAWRLPDVFSDCISQHHELVPAGSFHRQAAAVAAVDRIVELLGVGTPITADVLRSLIWFEHAAQYGQVVEAIAKIPAMIASFEEAPSTARVASKIIAEPAAELPSPAVVPFRLVLADKTEVACRFATATSVGFDAPNAMAENFLQGLTVVVSDEAFPVWVKVARCEARATGFAIEAVPFALSGKPLARWTELTRPRPAPASRPAPQPEPEPAPVG